MLKHHWSMPWALLFCFGIPTIAKTPPIQKPVDLTNFANKLATDLSTKFMRQVDKKSYPELKKALEQPNSFAHQKLHNLLRLMLLSGLHKKIPAENIYQQIYNNFVNNLSHIENSLNNITIPPKNKHLIILIPLSFFLGAGMALILKWLIHPANPTVLKEDLSTSTITKAVKSVAVSAHPEMKDQEVSAIPNSRSVNIDARPITTDSDTQHQMQQDEQTTQTITKAFTTVAVTAGPETKDQEVSAIPNSRAVEIDAEPRATENYTQHQLLLTEQATQTITKAFTTVAVTVRPEIKDQGIYARSEFNSVDDSQNITTNKNPILQENSTQTDYNKTTSNQTQTEVQSAAPPQVMLFLPGEIPHFTQVMMDGSTTTTIANTAAAHSTSDTSLFGHAAHSFLDRRTNSSKIANA